MRGKDPAYEDKFYDKSRLGQGKQPNGKIVNIFPMDGTVTVMFFDQPPDYDSYDIDSIFACWDDERMGGMYYVDLE